MKLPELSCAPVSRSLKKRDELVMNHLTEVYIIARKIHERLPVFVPLEDLVHSGVLGLIGATTKYDSTRKVQFKTFAQFRIRGAILDGLRKLDHASRRMREKSHMINTASELLSRRLCRQPTEEEIANEVGLELADLRKLAGTLRGLEPVDRQVAFGQDRMQTGDLIESAPAKPEESPFAQCLRSEMKQHLSQAMSNLSAREKRILSLYYFKQLTINEIASMLDVNSSRVSQIHSASLMKMRTHLEAKNICRNTRAGFVSSMV
jgi:RNA polymerase sigma factor for flagellar operon FliA